VRTRFFIAIWIDQLVQNVMHVIPKNVGHVSERQLSYLLPGRLFFQRRAEFILDHLSIRAMANPRKDQKKQ
jgi:hypothetical protein